VKWACGIANRDLGKLTKTGKNKLDDKQVDAMLAAAAKWPPASSTASSRSTSIRRLRHVEQHERQRSDRQPRDRAARGDRLAAAKPVHPNDHVNMGQSTNDTFRRRFTSPWRSKFTAVFFPNFVVCETHSRKRRKLECIHQDWAHAFGRRDSDPFGQEIGGFVRQIELSMGRATRAYEAVLELPVGGTAVGTASTRIPNSAPGWQRASRSKRGSISWKP